MILCSEFNILDDLKFLSFMKLIFIMHETVYFVGFFSTIYKYILILLKLKEIDRPSLFKNVFFYSGCGQFVRYLADHLVS